MPRREVDDFGVLWLNEPVSMYVTAPRAEQFFEGLLALIDGFCGADALAGEYLYEHGPIETRHGYEERMENYNGSEHLDLIRDILLQALGRTEKI